MEWRTSKICELYEIGSGISITPDKYGSGYPFLTFKDIFNSPYIKDKIETLVESSEKDRHNSSIQKGDVFLTRTSETAEELGMSTVALKDYPDATFNGFSKRLRPITEEIVPVYAAYFFRSPIFRAQASSMSSIITRASLNNTNISHFTIKYPSKIDQIKIGNILYSYDSQIENNQKRIKLLEQMAENLYKEWFVRFRFPGYETAEFEGGVPKGWTVVKVKECVDRLRFGTLYGKDSVESEGDVIVIDQSQEPYIGFHNNAPSHIADTQKPIILFGDHSCKFELMIIPFSLAENVVPFVAKSGIDTTFLYFTTHNLIQTTEYKRHWTEFVNKKILLPPVNLQREYTKRVIDMLSMKQQLIIKNRLLSKQRDLLLPRLMSGKLNI